MEERFPFLKEKKAIVTIGVIGLVGCLMSGIYLANSSKKKRRPCHLSLTTETTEVNERQLYETGLTDPQLRGLHKERIERNPHLKEISYRWIVNLKRGKHFQGVVLMYFWADRLPEGEKFLMNYSGVSVGYVRVNEVQVPRHEVLYLDHKIRIPKDYFIAPGANEVQIIYESQYSFLSSGLSSYLVKDENDRYLLKQQVIYMKSGPHQIEKMLPCLNCYNQCKIAIEVLHHKNFQVFSNNIKAQQRFASVIDYPEYRLFFDVKMDLLRMSQSIENQNMSCVSNNSYNSLNTIEKSNTIFYIEQLPSIHSAFVLCSQMVALQPEIVQQNHGMLLRYYCKESVKREVTRNISNLHVFINEILGRLQSEGIGQHLFKIDLLIVDDKIMDGYFAPGVIMVSEKALTCKIELKNYYLVARAILGVLLSKKQGIHFMTIDEILHLNALTFAKFEQFRNLIYLKNVEYHTLRRALLDRKQFKDNYEGAIVESCTKKLRFMVKEDLLDRTSPELKSIMAVYFHQPEDTYWSRLAMEYSLLPSHLSEQLLKISIKFKNVPTNPKLRENLRKSFAASRHLLSFYSDEQIEAQLNLFLPCDLRNMQKTLTRIIVRKKFTDYVTDKYERYLPIKSNRDETMQAYEIIKNYKEGKNMHHIGELKKEIKRVSYFWGNELLEVRKEIDCDLNCWMILCLIKIYPLHQELYDLVRTLQEICK